LFGLDVKAGGSQNKGKLTTAGRLQQISQCLRAKFTGLYYVNGGILGNGGGCKGSLWVKLIGSPLGTVPWIGALASLVIGLILICFSFSFGQTNKKKAESQVPEV
jgi:hypothetical protein